MEECLRRCPSSYRLKARNPKHDLILGLKGNIVHFWGSSAMQTVDINTWKPHKATKKEYSDYIIVLDALDNNHIITPAPYYDVDGVPDVMSIPEGIAIRLKYSDKFLAVEYQKDSEIFAIDMAKAAGIELMGTVASSRPLTYPEDSVEAANRFTEAGFSIFIGSGHNHGATGPVTIAGSLITDNAEQIAGIVMVQLMRAGTRILTNNFTFSQNMRTGLPNFGGIESALHMAAANQLARKYQIPKSSSVSAYSSSKRIDIQCGYEKSMTALIAALSGYTLVQFLGGIYGELTAHPVQAIIDDDIAGAIGRFLQGVEVSHETIALDLIEKIGPIPGFFLNTEHTRKWWKKEQFMPKVSDRLAYPDEWMNKGKKSELDYSKERMETILATHKVEVPLTQNHEDEIEKILKEAREYYKKKGLI